MQDSGQLGFVRCDDGGIAMTFIPPGRPKIEEPTRTLLLVEDDRASQSFLARGLRGLAGFRILLAQHGQEALDILQREEIDVLCTDLLMPVLDGYQLIREVSARYPHIPILVITAEPAEKLQHPPLQLGATALFTKPPRLSALMDEIRAAVAKPLDAEIRGISLQSLLQLLQWERETSTLIVRGPKGIGLVYVTDGQVIHGAYREKEGRDALFDILCWDDIQVRIVRSCKVAPTLHTPLEELLMDAAVAKDHQQAGLGQ